MRFVPSREPGVIYVTSEANARRLPPGRSELVQTSVEGQPETGPLPGAPPRVTHLDIHLNDQEYAPVAGLWEVREAIASMYNNLFRRGMPSLSTAPRTWRCAAVGASRSCALAPPSGQIHLGHFLPDYTAYEELLDIFRRFTPIPILLDPEHGYDFSLDSLRREISGRGLGALLLSNPCNPTGKAITGPELQSWVATARELDCTLLLDEFYSHYLWKEGPSLFSAAEFVEDVEKDPVVIFDGLTKNWRYPGWRVSWTVAPSKVIESLASAGSFLDGGGSRPMQSAALSVLTAEHARAEAEAIRTTFRRKRNRMLDGLRALGVRFEREPEGSFYCWGNLSNLPPSLNTGDKLFRAALKQQVIHRAGPLFRRRPRAASRQPRFALRASRALLVRGPSEATIDDALARLARVVQDASG